ncbi:hypothetical protein BH18ACT15_BH18ACT15_03410 [soil metagenome]
MPRRYPRKRPVIEVTAIGGNPSTEELAIITQALETAIEHEREAIRPSLWLRGARAQGRRLGVFDYRDRLAHEDAWRLSARFPFGGREYRGLWGRGDAK